MTEGGMDFQQVFTDYHPKIVGYLRRIVGELEAEDVAQEVFMKIGRSLDGFRGESRISTWIYRIATNTAMDHLRKPSSRMALRSPQGLADDGSVPGEDDSAPNDGALLIDALLIRKDMNECIRGIVEGLPENYRTVLVLSDLEGMTNAEIGEVLGLTQETVKIRLHRARARLRKELNEQCNFYRDGRNELACDRKSPMVVLKKL